MENNIKIIFHNEEREILLNILQPDLAQVIHIIVSENLVVSKENVLIESDNQEFDKDEFLDILVTVYDEFSEEISKFFVNIKEEIKTYYESEELSEEIIKRIKNEADY